MTQFYFDGQRFESSEGESVLDTLVKAGHELNYSCKKGICKTCIVQHVSGTLSVGSQRGLDSTLKENGYVCSCQCRPTDGLKLKSVMTQDLFISGSLLSKKFLSESVVEVVIKLSQPIEARAGQYVNLRRFDGLTRSYSLASGSDARQVVLHVRRKYNGQFSDWLFHRAGNGERLLVQGPLGKAYYQPHFKQDTLVVIASGTGLGAAYFMVQAAIERHHEGPIYLYYGANNIDELYMHSQLLQAAMRYRQLQYLGCVSKLDSMQTLPGKVVLGDPFEHAAEQHQFDRQHRVVLCGEPSFVNAGRETAFLNGVPIERVHAIAFEYKNLRSRERA
ncbi:2Fe-2S iron-sulfur cluster-binding protein [Shewanella waksmanii]|uniref:2Fe-2S iron-sulfur cluster-binding protein n=1 Tax=Shewanella waksmanii TaxID=213783 RepID=UPI0037367302